MHTFMLSLHFVNSHPSPNLSPTGTDPYAILPLNCPYDCPCWAALVLWITNYQINFSFSSLSFSFFEPFLWLEFTIIVLLLLMMLFIAGWLFVELSALSESESLSSSFESLDDDELSSPIWVEKKILKIVNFYQKEHETYVIDRRLRLLLLLLLLLHDCTRCFWHRCWGR